MERDVAITKQMKTERNVHTNRGGLTGRERGRDRWIER